MKQQNNSLEEYQKKRKFNQTPEPKGKIIQKNKNLNFVIQKHQASHLHYDLRLELNGVLKSWAVPKGPSLNPKDKRLAILVEDHPLDYETFEGMIPKGNYGAGNVIVWDIGIYLSPGVEDRKENERIFSKEFKKGHLNFFLKGQKLKGEFSLTRFKKIKNKENWLLIKKNDKFASENDILKKDLSVLTGKKIEEKNFPGNLGVVSPMPHNIRPMHATLIDKPFNNPEWIFEIKWDGYRAISEIDLPTIKFYSRNKQSFEKKYPLIFNSLKKLNQTMVLDGEVVALDDNGKPSFQLLQDYQKKPKTSLIYYIFDVLYFNGHDLTKETLTKRKEILKNILPQLSNIKFTEHIEKDGILFFKAAKEQGLEGIIAKKKDSFYFQGIRSKDWLKIKTLLMQEAVIAGFTNPRGGRSYFGALVLGIYKNNELIYVGHTGSGFNENQLKEIYKKLKSEITSESSFKNPPITNEKVTWVNPKFVCEIKFFQWTKDMRMRQPIFVGIREDKAPKEVNFEKPINLSFKDHKLDKEQTESSKLELVKNKTETKNNNKKIIIDNHQIILSNLNKIFWPNEGYSKKDLIDYYLKIAPFILPYLKDRPESLHRFPNGITGKSFFQKDVGQKTPPWIKTAKICSQTYDKEINYLLCQDKATLIYLANLGCIELNPWNSRIQKLDNPDYLVIDLDPENISFEYVVKAAQATKDVLEKIGIESYCKTSGATGLHIYIPVNAKYTYKQVRDFSKILVSLIHYKIRDFTSIIRSPKKRQKKVYLDFMQNNRGQTLSSPYCVRPTPGALVSTPLEWEEVKNGLNPSDFTIKTIFKRLDKYGDIFKQVLEKGLDIEKALSKISLNNNF